MQKALVTILSLAVLLSLALTSCLAKDAAQPASSLASKVMPQPSKPRTARSLGDMFEKVRSKIFGNRKQTNSATNAQVQPAASANAAQRQPWGDLNSINQQFNPYSPLASQYQYLNQQYNPLSGFVGAQSGANSYPALSGASSQNGVSSLISGIDGQQVQQPQSQSSLNPAANSNSGSNGGLLSSASHMIAQYLSPSSASGSSSNQVGQNPQQVGQNQLQASSQQQQQNLLSPQQQQQQSQYNEFASFLDSMVAQTGANSNQRQPNINQYLGSGPSAAGQQGLQSQSAGSQGYQAQAGNILGSSPLVGDNEMSGSSNIGSYLPASPQQASQKSSMVGLAEQLAPGANFNKLVSFPFSLTSNEDPSKDGRFKLHIPFLNQHVKRSDQPQPQAQQSVSSPISQQQQRQYLNPYYSQQYNSIANQQLVAQSSQVVPTIVSPQSSVSQLQSSVGAQQNSPAVSSAVIPASQPSSVSSASSSSSSSSSSSVPQSSSSSIHSSPNNPSSASQSVSVQANSRPWSVADLQSNSSSSKLIPVQSASSSSADAASSAQS